MKLNRSKPSLLLSLLTLMFSSSCMLTGQSIVSSGTTTAPVIETPIERFYRLASDMNYLKECRDQHPNTSTQQIGFKDIYPGKTTTEQIREKLGEPIRSDSEWLYYTDDSSFSYQFITKDNVVDFAVVRMDTEILLPVKNILAQYGCPDLIIAVQLDPPASSERPTYNTTFFIYHTAGIEIRFERYPVSYSDVASIMSFIKPLSLRDFLEDEYENGFLVNDFSSPVSLIKN